MKRVVNFRSFVFAAIMLMLTSLACLIAVNIPWLGLIMLISLIFAPIVIAFIKRKKIETYKFVTFIFTAVVSMISIVFFFVTAYTWRPAEIKSGVYKVYGVVDDNYWVDGNRKVILKNLELNGSDVSGRLQLIVKDKDGIFNDVAPGYKLTFSAYVEARDLISGYSVNTNYLRSNIRYESKVDSSDIKIRSGLPGLMGSINLYVKNMLNDRMGEKFGAIAYGMLSGDKNEISYSVRNSFTAAGIAHILAVSGLHIGFLMAIITFIMRKLKVRALPTFITSAVVLFLYSLFAGFSPSVIRASIMFMVGSVAMLFGEQKDGLNSLGVAVTALLTFSPIMLFDAGFIMSVGAVFGLINFSPIIIKGLVKIKLPEKIADIIAVPTAAQLGVLPASICFFGKVQLFAILINIALMPLMTVAFIAIFVSLLFSIIPPLKFMVTAAGFLVKGLTAAADFCSGLPLAVLAIKPSAVSFIIYPLYFISGGFINCKHRRAVSFISWILIVAIIVVLILIGNLS